MQENNRLTYYTKIVDSLTPFWMGTPWDFNGTTEIPRNGQIACGYFVTTLLRDAGMPIARIKTAQKAASEIIQATCLPASINRFGSLQALTHYLQSIPDHILMVIGLDYHVGFVYKRNGKAYFLHSTYLGSRCVMNEPLQSSQAIATSKSFYIGKIRSR
jgi:hypothetical protein